MQKTERPDQHFRNTLPLYYCGMEQWDEQALREINNLDAARLAIRGALSTIRDLQDANAGLKGQAQDEAAKRKHLETQLAKMDEKIADWREQAEVWERERAERER